MNETNGKTMGQIGYEAFAGAFLPAGSGIPWDDNNERVHAAWEAAAAAVLAQPHRGTVVGGPIEMRDYDYITLAQPHRLVMPNQPEPIVPAGTRLFMVKPEPGEIGLTFETGAACKVGDWPDDGPIPPARTEAVATD